MTAHASPSSKATFAKASSPRSNPLLAAYVKERPGVARGAGTPWATASSVSRRSGTRSGPSRIARARRQQRGSAQDSRTGSDDHRPVRRCADRVRAGHPVQTGLRRELLQLRQAVFGSGQLGACEKGVRGGYPIDPSYVEAFDALGFALEALGDNDRAVATYERRSRSTRSARAYSLPHVNLSAYYNRPESRQGARVRAAGAGRWTRNPTARCFRRPCRRAAGPAGDAVDALNARQTSTRACPRITTCLPESTGASAGWTRARRRWRCFKRLERESAELERSGALRRLPCRWTRQP